MGGLVMAWPALQPLPATPTGRDASPCGLSRHWPRSVRESQPNTSGTSGHRAIAAITFSSMVAVVEFQNASIEYGPLIPAPGCPPSSTCMMSPSLYLVNSGFCFEDILSRLSNTRFDASRSEEHTTELQS